jgi:hypothetical protein
VPAARPKFPHLDLAERTALDEREPIIVRSRSRQRSGGTGLSTIDAASGRAAFLRKIQGSRLATGPATGSVVTITLRGRPRPFFGAEGASSATAFFRGRPGLRLAGRESPVSAVSCSQLVADDAGVSVC